MKPLKNFLGQQGQQGQQRYRLFPDSIYSGGMKRTQIGHGAWRMAHGAGPFAVLSLALCAMLSALCSAFAGYLDATTYYITTNSASQTITITNWPGSGSATYAWYPAALLYNERSATTGVLVNVMHVRARSSPVMSTNLTSTTNVLWTHAVPVAVSTNYVFPGRFYCVPSSDKIVITSVSTNAELILIREVAL